jgi:chemotaxis response regulator CheB
MKFAIGWILGAAMGTGVMAVHEKRSIEALTAHCVDGIHKVESHSLDGIEEIKQDCIAKINQLGAYARSRLERE